MSIFEKTSTIRINFPKHYLPYVEKEINDLGYTADFTNYSGIEFQGTMEDCMKLNLQLRTAHKVLFLVTGFEARNVEHLYKNSNSFAWEEIISESGYFSIESNISNESIKDFRIANLKLKDAIADRFNEKFEKRPFSGGEKNQTVLFLNWVENQVKIYIDTSGETIARHNYRKNPFKAPLQETLAAAILIASGYNGTQNLINPMCGSGTLAIEACLMAKNIAPGLSRHNFGFMHLLGYKKSLWEGMMLLAKSEINPVPNVKIIATDIDPQAIRAALQNAREAGVESMIDFDACPFEETVLPEEGENWVVLNPEYGERLGEIEGLKIVYGEIGDFFKKKCTGSHAFLFTGNMELAKEIGLRPFMKRDFFSAKIECKLFGFKMYKGSIRDMYVNKNYDENEENSNTINNSDN